MVKFQLAAILLHSLTFVTGSLNASQGPEALAARTYFYVGGRYVDVMHTQGDACQQFAPYLTCVAGRHRHACHQESDVRREAGTNGRTTHEVSHCLRSWTSPNRHSTSCSMTHWCTLLHLTDHLRIGSTPPTGVEAGLHGSSREGIRSICLISRNGVDHLTYLATVDWQRIRPNSSQNFSPEFSILDCGLRPGYIPNGLE